MANGFQAVPGGRIDLGGLPQTDPKGLTALLQKGMQSPMAKQAGGGIFIDWLLNKLVQGGHERGMRNIQMEGLRSQAEMVTPQSLYQQAALPQAQEEERMAHTALMSQLSGGVLGPQQLAKGEFMIGG